MAGRATHGRDRRRVKDRWYRAARARGVRPPPDQSKCWTTKALAAVAMAARLVRSPSSDTTAAAKAAGSSAMSRCRPGSPGSPSAPMVVDTTGVPAAMDSKIFRRVPPPMRSGTMETAASCNAGRTSSTRPVTTTRAPSASRCTADVGSRPDDAEGHLRHLGADERQDITAERRHGVLVRQPVHRPDEDQVQGAGRHAGRGLEVGRVDAGRDHCGGCLELAGVELMKREPIDVRDGEHPVEPRESPPFEAAHTLPLLPIQHAANGVGRGLRVAAPDFGLDVVGKEQCRAGQPSPQVDRRHQEIAHHAIERAARDQCVEALAVGAGTIGGNRVRAGSSRWRATRP